MQKRTITSYVSILCTSLLLFSCVSSPEPTKEINTASSTTVTSDEEYSPTATQELIVISELVEKTPPVVEEKPSPLELYKAYIKNKKIVSESFPSQTLNGKAFSKPFAIKVIDTEGNALKDISVTITHPIYSNKGTISFAQEQLLSDENGRVSYSMPTPEFSCNSTVSYYITPEDSDDETLSFIHQNIVKQPYKVYTNKMYKSFSVALLDYTLSGNPIKNQSATSSALLQSLYKKGFHRIGNSDWISQINNGNISILYRDAKTLFKNNVDYLVFGKIHYATPIEKTESGLYTVTMHTEFSVLNMKTGEIDFTSEFDISAQDSSEWAVLNTIRKKYISPKITDLLYYGI